MPSSEDRFPRILFIVTSPICTKAAASSSYLPLPRPFPLPHPHPQLLHKQQHCPNTPPRHITVLYWLSLLPCPCLCPALLTYAALATNQTGPLVLSPQHVSSHSPPKPHNSHYTIVGPSSTHSPTFTATEISAANLMQIRRLTNNLPAPPHRPQENTPTAKASSARTLLRGTQSSHSRPAFSSHSVLHASN